MFYPGGQDIPHGLSSRADPRRGDIDVSTEMRNGSAARCPFSSLYRESVITRHTLATYKRSAGLRIPAVRRPERR